jgi:hypothetical protein
MRNHLPSAIALAPHALAVSILFSPGVSAQDVGWELRGATDSQPSPRRNHFMAFDAQRGVTVLFGGVGAAGDNGETWEWNGTQWIQYGSGDLSARTGGAMVYDQGRGVSVLFGGYSNAVVSTLYGETWERSGTTWAQRIVPGPSPRHSLGMVYDRGRGVTVLFGGYDSTQPLGDTWEWDGSAWSLRSIDGPSARWAHSMAYDLARGVTVLSGGITGNGLPNAETWEWNGNTWTQRVDGPAANYAAAMVYDLQRGVSVLFGGVTETGRAAGDTWDWNGSTWTIISQVGPAPRWGPAMAYDPANGATVLFGGTRCGGVANGETWELSVGGSFCPADFNGDGFVDFFDYDAFVTAFENGSPDADFNQDCFRDFFDYDGFVEAFETGC